MYDELITALRACVDKDKDCSECPYYERCINNTSGKHAAMVNAADAIEELIEVIQNHDFLESLIKPRWVSVTDRLPREERCFYLCYTDEGVIVECLWTNNRTGLGPLGEWGWRFVDVPSYQKITHWMPLPEPPKENGKSET